jgi:hypothetical protein
MAIDLCLLPSAFCLFFGTPSKVAGTTITMRLSLFRVAGMVVPAPHISGKFLNG